VSCGLGLQDHPSTIFVGGGEIDSQAVSWLFILIKTCEPTFIFCSSYFIRIRDKTPN